MQNYWQSLLDGRIVQVFAGVSASDSSQGVVYVVLTAADRSSKEFIKLNTPGKDGSVRIVTEDQFILILLAENGNEFLFDATELIFVK